MLHVELFFKNPETLCMLLSLFPPTNRVLFACVSCLPLLSPSRPPGAVFDRQASIRRSLINTDTVPRRPKKVKRRKTISGLPDNFNQELGMDLCGALCANCLHEHPALSHHLFKLSLLFIRHIYARLGRLFIYREIMCLPIVFLPLEFFHISSRYNQNRFPKEKHPAQSHGPLQHLTGLST